MNRIRLYYIDIKLVRDYQKVDDNVLSVSPQTNKQNRPFLGVVILQNNKRYCIPISSPKPKHKRMKSGVDLVKIIDNTKDNNNQYPIIGVLNINNMIPISNEYIKPIDITIYNDDSKATKKYKSLLKKQIDWCHNNQNVIINKAEKVYDIVTMTPDNNRRLVKRSVDFKKLEKILERKLQSLDKE